MVIAMTNRIDKLRKKLLKNTDNEAALITTSVNRRYFSYFSSSAGILFVTQEEAYLLVDFRYKEAAEQNAKNVTVIKVDKFSDTLKSLIKKHEVKKIHMENSEVPYLKFKEYETLFKSVGAEPVFGNSLYGIIDGIRIIKDDYEIKKITEAQRLTDAAFSHVLTKIKEGVSEREIALEIEFFMRKEGAETVSFDLITVTGAKTSQCHGVPSDDRVKKGDFVLMDTGAMLDGYNSDMTRTVAVSYVTDEQKDVYETVLKAHLEAFNLIKPGNKCSEPDKMAREIIDKHYKGTFGHALGHGVGAEIHENPRLSVNDNTVLKSGMVVTNEPGIYLEGKFGVRIEDMILVREKDSVSLAKSPKELIIL